MEPAPARARRGESGERAHPGRARDGVTHAGAAPAGSGYGIPGRASRDPTGRVDRPGAGDRARDRRGRDLAGVDDPRFDRATPRFADDRSRRPGRSSTIGWASCRAGAGRRAATRRRSGPVNRPAGRRSWLAGLADVAEGRLPLLVRADRERQIRDAVDFAAQESLRMILSAARNRGGWPGCSPSRRSWSSSGRRRRCRSTRTCRMTVPYTLASDLRAPAEVAISTLGAGRVVRLPYEAGRRSRSGSRGRRTGGDHPRPGRRSSGSAIAGHDRARKDRQPGRHRRRSARDPHPRRARHDRRQAGRSRQRAHPIVRAVSRRLPFTQRLNRTRLAALGERRRMVSRMSPPPDA